MPTPNRSIRALVPLLILVFLLATPAEAKRRKKPPAEAQAAPAAEAAPPAPAPPVAEGSVEVVPDAARADLAAGAERYRAGDFAGALEALQRAEAAGARTGLLYYQMGFCKKSLGDPAANADLKRKAVPYFERLVAEGTDEVDPYYYLAASYFQDLGEAAKGMEVAARAVDARHAGRFRRDLDGEGYFRLGRLFGFVLQARMEAAPTSGPEAEHATQLLGREQIELYRLAAEKLQAEPGANKVYLVLALVEVGAAAREEGRIEDAIAAFGQASDVDPLQEAPGYGLFDLGREACIGGDYPAALAAWRAIRGPDEAKTAAQYGIRLMEQAIAYGSLPARFEDKPVETLDAATLERGILEAAKVLQAAPADPAAGESSAGAPPPPSADEVQRARGVFLALTIAYMNQGSDLRGLVLQNQLVPLIFR